MENKLLKAKYLDYKKAAESVFWADSEMNNRKQNNVNARYSIVYALLLDDYSEDEISINIGCNRTLVYHIAKTVPNWIDTDMTFKRKLYQVVNLDYRTDVEQLYDYHKKMVEHYESIMQSN